MTYPVTLLGERHEIPLTRKKMRTVRLRLADTGEFALSAPLRMPEAEIARFVAANTAWMETALRRLRDKVPPQQQETLAEGSAVRVLGTNLTVRLEQAAQTRLRVEPETAALHIAVRDPRDPDAVRRAFDKWWREQTQGLCERLTDKYMPPFARRGIARPVLTIRKMSSRWGSCLSSQGRITLNYYLLRAPYECVEYVVLHELTHLVNPTHNQAFYAAIAAVMPDWSARRQKLRSERSC